MRQQAHVIIAIALAALMVVAGATAGAKPAPFAFHTTSRTVNYTVETQYDGVHNRTGCLWTYDDHWDAWATGYLAAGAAAGAADCLIADGYPHLWSLVVYAPKAGGLEVSFCFDPGGCVTTSRSRPDGNRAIYTLCAYGPAYATREELPPVPDSDGGVGIPTTVTASVANVGGQTQRDLQAQLRFSPPPGNVPCVGATLEAYPLRWQEY